MQRAADELVASPPPAHHLNPNLTGVFAMPQLQSARPRAWRHANRRAVTPASTVLFDLPAKEGALMASSTRRSRISASSRAGAAGEQVAAAAIMPANHDQHLSAACDRSSGHRRTHGLEEGPVIGRELHRAARDVAAHLGPVDQQPGRSPARNRHSVSAACTLNPPRASGELIPCRKTSREVLEGSDFLTTALGRRGLREGHADIGNRIGVFSILSTMHTPSNSVGPTRPMH